MDFKNYLTQSAEEINQTINQILEDWDKEVGEVSPKIVPLNKAFIEACQGGKRLRGALVKFGYELAGKTFTSEILKPAAAVEIFQTAILAHDDIIDKSSLRRGKPTLYKVLGGDHYGTSQTICLGDVGFFLTMRLISESNFPDKEKNQGLLCFAKTAMDTGLGEILDVELPTREGEKSEKDVVMIFRLKTAEYTIIGPLQLGAILGGADQPLLDVIWQFGESLGIAFQIQDDNLGVFGTEEAIGKPVTSDIEEGKITLLSVYAFEHADSSQKAILDSYYGKGEINQDQLEQIRNVFIETGALDYAQKEAEKYVTEAKKMIPEMTKDPEKATFLNQMADFLVQRKN